MVIYQGNRQTEFGLDGKVNYQSVFDTSLSFTANSWMEYDYSSYFLSVSEFGIFTALKNLLLLLSRSFPNETTCLSLMQQRPTK